MAEWQVALICMSLVVGAVLFSSLIKIIYNKICEKKGIDPNKSKLEYPLASVSLILSFACVTLFLKFYMKASTDTALKYGATYAASANTVYLFIIQLIRKGFVGVINGIANVIKKIKGSKNPVAETPQIIDETVETATEKTDEEKQQEQVEEKGKEIFDILFPNK